MRECVRTRFVLFTTARLKSLLVLLSSLKDSLPAHARLHADIFPVRPHRLTFQAQANEEVTVW